MGTSISISWGPYPLRLEIFGDPAGILKKLYSGNLSTQSAWAESLCPPLLIEMATIAHKILTIRFIKLWKYSCRIDLFPPVTEKV
ncbi:MAG: hypothetical protein A2156_10800 [Deltaproteobacteria bacterium RBG_16_48_10]|nr:MAG: hypothetical protein A2156_10800 [Deltaproteobacteria bacterium RBG_16_48_10]